MSLPLKTKRLSENAKLPTKVRKKDAGFDLYCVADNEFAEDGFRFLPGQIKRFKTDVAIAAPDGYMLLLEDRSGMGNKGVTKFAGVIDQLYTGEIQVILCNLSKDVVTIKPGDRIIQFLVLPVPDVEVVEVDNLDETDRGDKSFGSSGA